MRVAGSQNWKRQPERSISSGSASFRWPGWWDSVAPRRSSPEFSGCCHSNARSICRPLGSRSAATALRTTSPAFVRPEGRSSSALPRSTRRGWDRDTWNARSSSTCRTARSANPLVAMLDTLRISPPRECGFTDPVSAVALNCQPPNSPFASIPVNSVSDASEPNAPSGSDPSRALPFAHPSGANAERRSRKLP